MIDQVKKPRSKRWVWISGILAVLVVGVIVVALTTQKDAKRYMADAQSYAQKGNLSAALIQLRNAVRKEPANPVARYQLAVMSLRTGDPVSAEKEAKVALERGLSEDVVFPVLAAAYLDQGKFQVALDTIGEGDRPKEVEAEIRTLRGLALLGIRDIGAAEQSFQSVLALDPYKSRAEIGLARVQIARADLAGAEARLDKVLAQDMASEVASEAYILKAQLRRVSGDVDGALEAYGKTIERLPGNLRARIERAQMLIEQKQIDSAQADVRYVLERVVNHPIAVNLQARIFLERQNEPAAYELLQRQGVNLARYAPNLLLMGRLQVDRNQPEAAQTNLTQYLQAVPGDTDVRLFVASMLVRRDLPDQAIAVLRGAPLEASSDVRILRMLASASLRAGRVSEAGAWLDRASESATDARSRTQIAADRMSIGQTDAAIKDLGTAIEMEPSAGSSKILMAAAQIRRGQLDEAEKIAKDLQTEDPASPLADNLLGGITLARGDRVGARRYFETALEKKRDFVPAQTNLAKLDIFERKFDDAARRYLAVHEQNPKNMEAMLGLSGVEQQRNRPEQAGEWLTKAISTDPQAVPPRVALVNFRLLQRDYAKALDAARELRKISPDSPTAIEALARAQVANGDMAGAADTYRALVAVDPSAFNYERLVSALVAAGDTEGAKTTLQAGTKAHPQASNLVGALAGLLQRSGQGEEALKVAKAWQARNPRSAVGDLIVSEVMTLQGDYKEAERAAEQGYGKEPSSRAAVFLARARMAQGEANRASDGLEEYLQIAPNDVPARELLASVYLSARQYDKAMLESERILKVQPSNPIVLNNLAWIYQMKNDPRALETAERANAAAPNAPAVMDTYGYILVQKGDVDRGLPLLRRAYDESRKSAEIGYHLAVALHKSGHAAEAREVLASVLASPDSFDDKPEAKKLLDSLPVR